MQLPDAAWTERRRVLRHNHTLLPYTHSCCKSYLPKATKNRHLAGYSWSKSVGEMNSCDSFTHGWQRARKVADTFIMMTLNSHGSRICLNAGLLTFFWQVGLKWGTALWTCTHTHTCQNSNHLAFLIYFNYYHYRVLHFSFLCLFIFYIAFIIESNLQLAPLKDK